MSINTEYYIRLAQDIRDRTGSRGDVYNEFIKDITEQMKDGFIPLGHINIYELPNTKNTYRCIQEMYKIPPQSVISGGNYTSTSKKTKKTKKINKYRL